MTILAALRALVNLWSTRSLCTWGGPRLGSWPANQHTTPYLIMFVTCAYNPALCMGRQMPAALRMRPWLLAPALTSEGLCTLDLGGIIQLQLGNQRTRCQSRALVHLATARQAKTVMLPILKPARRCRTQLMRASAHGAGSSCRLSRKHLRHNLAALCPCRLPGS